MTFETKRLVLRPWEEADAQALYLYASDPDVGPAAGWTPHASVEESLEIIRTVFAEPEQYALCLQEDGRVIGAIGLNLKGGLDDAENECELGYWVGKPFWGQGIVPEAAREILRHAFENLGMKQVCCCYYDGNNKSKRVQEKLGFVYQQTKDIDVPRLGTTRAAHINLMTRERWDWVRLYDAAKAVQLPREVSRYVEAGGVAAAIMSASGAIYTGVCVDTSCTLGICAERNAIFSMLTAGESEITKVLALLRDGSCGAPCGACRELMVQLMPGAYAKVGVMLDYANNTTTTLGNLTPEWWIG